MAESLSSWLALREAADARARSETLTRALGNRLPRATTLRIVDLGTGAGSNVRYLVPRLPHPQHWLLVDRDPALLAEAAARMPQGAHVEAREMNLSILDPEIVAGRHLVTASALLDLVSADWLRALARKCRAQGAAALFALTYDGRSSCVPFEPEDEMIRELMNRHQRNNDKGFGRAAGPDAADCAERAFAAAGYKVRREPSDWVLMPDEHELQRRLIEGWAGAAREIAADRAVTIDDWRRRRIAHVDASRSRISVGHQDLIAWPAR